MQPQTPNPLAPSRGAQLGGGGGGGGGGGAEASQSCCSVSKAMRRNGCSSRQGHPSLLEPRRKGLGGSCRPHRPAKRPRPQRCQGQSCSMRVSAGRAPLADAGSFARAVPRRSPSAPGVEWDVQIPSTAAAVSCQCWWGARPGVTLKGCK